jgi:hypothetical protein
MDERSLRSLGDDMGLHLQAVEGLDMATVGVMAAQDRATAETGSVVAEGMDHMVSSAHTALRAPTTVHHSSLTTPSRTIVTNPIFLIIGSTPHVRLNLSNSPVPKLTRNL